MIVKLELDSEKFIELWESGYTGFQLCEYFSKETGREKLSMSIIKRTKKELGIVGRPTKNTNLDKNIKEAEIMWKNEEYTKQDIIKKFHCSRITLENRADEYNWGVKSEYNLLTLEIKDRLFYNKDTGIFIWKNGPLKGRVAGSINNDTGYLSVNINNKHYTGGRLAHIIMGIKISKNEIIDHINHIRSDNSWDNLRIVSKKENAKNYTLRKDNTSGYAGISFHTQTKKWCVRIADNNGGFFQKEYNTKEAAILVAKEKYKEFGYHENHGKPLEQPYDNSKRQKLIKQQTPENMDKDLMKLILDNTPEGYHDDHIIPLSKDGLHEPSNIQYITKEENLKKGNKLDYICKSAINPIEYLKDIQIIV